jgi:hypothetical protein
MESPLGKSERLVLEALLARAHPLAGGELGVVGGLGTLHAACSRLDLSADSLTGLLRSLMGRRILLADVYDVPSQPGQRDADYVLQLERAAAALKERFPPLGQRSRLSAFAS